MFLGARGAFGFEPEVELEDPKGMLLVEDSEPRVARVEKGQEKSAQVLVRVSPRGVSSARRLVDELEYLGFVVELKETQEQESTRDEVDAIIDLEDERTAHIWLRRAEPGFERTHTIRESRTPPADALALRVAELVRGDVLPRNVTQQPTLAIPLERVLSAGVGFAGWGSTLGDRGVALTADAAYSFSEHWGLGAFAQVGLHASSLGVTPPQLSAQRGSFGVEARLLLGRELEGRFRYGLTGRLGARLLRIRSETGPAERRESLDAWGGAATLLGDVEVALAARAWLWLAMGFEFGVPVSWPTAQATFTPPQRRALEELSGRSAPEVLFQGLIGVRVDL